MSSHRIKVTKVISDPMGAPTDENMFSSNYSVPDQKSASGEAEQAYDAAKMKILMDAAQVGIDDIAAGRFETFQSTEELENRILEIWDEAIRDAKAA